MIRLSIALALLTSVAACSDDGDGTGGTDPVCGNGMLENGEYCDDGNDVDGDGCDSDCTISPACGDGIVDAGEECDDGNNTDGDGCQANCLDPACGDGVTDAGEDCDDSGESVNCNADCTAAVCGDGTVNATAGEACDDGGESATCNDNCTVAACGDGTRNETAGEDCDDGNNVDGDGCQSNCLDPVCGDGIVDPTEDCDDAGESAACNIDCTFATCGDGTLNPSAGEACDDGGESMTCDADCTSATCGDGTLNTTAGEDCDDSGESMTCDADCTSATCGDGTLNTTAGEACDDGNNVDGDTCQSNCLIPECGDGIIDMAEECDDAGESAACDLDCTFAVCGDSFVNMTAMEQCDDGGESATCDADCTSATCGDGTFNMSAGEECDDGGESAACNIDCTSSTCGDGTLNMSAGEECDDGGESAACDLNCTVASCGDGTVNMSAGEECDDSNNADGDGCQATCLLPVCGDDIIDAGEICDDGNTTNGDGCSTTCQVEMSIGAGREHTCILLSTGRVRCWGHGTLGRLGYGNPLDVGDTPMTLPSSAGDVDVGGTVLQLAVGDYHNCAVLTNGALRCWGDNIDGQLGYATVERIGDDEAPSSMGDISVGGTVRQVDANGSHTCALLDNGDVRCWGDGFFGQLGYGNTDDIGDDELPSSVDPVVVGGQVEYVGLGDRHSCVLLASGDVRCWGSGAQGRLGYGNSNTIGDDETPMSAGTISLGGPVANIAVGDMHTCARYPSGDVRCWGQPYWGQLGYGNLFPLGDNELPTDVGFVQVGGSVAELYAGREHTCAILSTGGVRCWGRNQFGQLGYGNVEHIGDNELPSTVSDVSIGGTGTIIGFTASGWHNCVLYDSGELRCWGSNQFGHLGYGNTDTIGDDELPSSLLSGVPYL